MSVAEKMTAIADAIRNKTGKTDKLSLDEMATEINEISTGERDINPEWTNWSYFCAYRPDLAKKLKYGDTSKGTNFSHMFYYCQIAGIKIPEIDTSKGTNFEYMFDHCSNMLQIPTFDTHNGTNFNYMFNSCGNLKSVPTLNTSKGTHFRYMFSGCSNLTSVALLNLSSATASNLASMFSGCSALVDLNIEGDLGVSGLSLSASPLLSHDSLLGVLNALKDRTGESGTWKVTLGATNLAKLTAEEIAIAEGKGWTLA